MGSRRYPEIKRHQTLDGKWRVVLIPGKGKAGRILFEHIDKEKAKTYEELYKQGRIK